MLFDPKWQKPEVKSDNPLDLRNIIAWLETKDPSATYDYTKSDKCLLGQYLAEVYGLSANAFYPLGARVHLEDIPPIVKAVVSSNLVSKYYTFGEALKRAKALL